MPTRMGGVFVVLIQSVDDYLVALIQNCRGDSRSGSSVSWFLSHLILPQGSPAHVWTAREGRAVNSWTGAARGLW